MTSPVAALEMPLLELADKAVDWVKRHLPAGGQAELFMCRGRERGIEVREGRLETMQESQDQGVGLRVLQGGRMGFAYAAGLDLPILEHIFRQVIEQLPFIPPDEHRALPVPEAVSKEAQDLSPSMTITSKKRSGC